MNGASLDSFTTFNKDILMKGKSKYYLSYF